MNTSYFPNRLTNRSLTSLILTLLLTQAACSANSPIQMHKEKTNPYYVDAQLCRAKNSSASPDSPLHPSASLDTTGYLACMQNLGYQQDSKTDPLIKAIALCQKGSVTYSASGTQGIRPQTPDGFRDCLKLRGFSSAPR